MANPLEMRGLSFLEWSADVHDLFTSLGFSKTHRHVARAAEVYRQGSIAFVVDRDPGSYATRHRAEHGPGVTALGFAFADPRAAFDAAVRRGATPFAERGASFDAPAIVGVGGTLIYFVDARAGIERELVALDQPVRVAEKGFLAIDHLTNNVRKGELAKWSAFYKDTFGFTDVRRFDIEGSKTGLLSYALRSPCGTFAIPLNEDKDERGQIAEYLREHGGPGVQHIALLTRDILASLDLVGGAVPTLDIDPAYYAEAFARVPNVREDRSRIRGHQVLVDGDAEGYLLQIFTKNVVGPAFFEIIQRENHLSFGEGNFGALFRSLERDQERRGVL
jgi:4-hydroxyphenylpyruvate dioxygenase